MDFYTVSEFKKTDSWDYFFDNDLVSCEKNEEGSKIIVADEVGYITMFNFIKMSDMNSKAVQVACNRRNDPVSCLEITS